MCDPNTSKAGDGGQGVDGGKKVDGAASPLAEQEAQGVKAAPYSPRGALLAAGTGKHT